MNLNKRAVIASAFATALVAPGILMAHQQAEMPSYKAEKCYGIARAGKNDCASQGNNSCAGTSKVNADPKAWMFVPEGVCERIVGGSREAR